MFLFENTILVVTLGTVAVLVLLVRRMLTGDPALGRSLGIATIAMSGLVAINWLVETPRERIATLCKELGRIVDNGNVMQIGDRLSSDFRAFELDKSEFLDRLTAVLTNARLDHVRIRDIEVVSESGDLAIAAFSAYSNIRTTEGFAAALPTRWRLRFTRRGDNWLVNGIESIPVPPLHLKDPFLNR